MNTTVNAGRNNVRELTADELSAISGGKVDVIKAMGNTKDGPSLGVGTCCKSR
jgi:bacteriocin-like protein